MNVNTRELQKHLTVMMKWFHNFCEVNNLRYYALGGTMLGAIRHNGFIPWDDDIDVGMPRKDYERLIDLIGNKVFEGYMLETPCSNSFEYRYPYCKLYDVKTVLTENTWPKLKRGIFIDVFPLDGLGNDRDIAEVLWSRINNKANIIWARTCALRQERSFTKNIAVLLAHIVPKCFIQDKTLLQKMDALCKTYDFDSSEIVSNIYGNWGMKETMHRNVFGSPKLYVFEDLMIYGAQDADAYLTSLYGDWKKLPPEEKRVTHHDYVEYDLNSSYL